MYIIYLYYLVCASASSTIDTQSVFLFSNKMLNILCGQVDARFNNGDWSTTPAIDL